MGDLFSIEADAFKGISNEGDCPKCEMEEKMGLKLDMANTLTLYINYAGKRITLEVSPHFSIHQLKKIIKMKHEIEVSEQDLVFEGTSLHDGYTVGGYQRRKGLEDASTLHLITATKGIKQKHMHYNCQTGNIIIGPNHGWLGMCVYVTKSDLSTQVEYPCLYLIA